MSTYNEKEYFPILTTIIHEDVVVPFDCYILLKSNNRIVQIVKRNEPFEKSRLIKLQSFNITKIYITHNDQPGYVEYLRSYFKTDEGSVILKEAFQQNPTGPIEGVPEEIANEFSALKTDVTKETITQPKEETPPPQPAKPEEEIVESKEKFGKVITLLKEKAENLEEKLRFKSSITKDDETVISDVTQRIKENLEFVQGVKDTVTENGKVIIKNVTDKMKEDVLVLHGIATDPGKPERKPLKSLVDKIQKKLNQIENITVSSSEPSIKQEENVVRIKNVTEKLQHDVVEIKHLIQKKDNITVSETLSGIITALEETLNAKIEILPKNAEKRRIEIKSNNEPEKKSESKAETEPESDTKIELKAESIKSPKAETKTIKIENHLAELLDDILEQSKSFQDKLCAIPSTPIELIDTYNPIVDKITTLCEEASTPGKKSKTKQKTAAVKQETVEKPQTIQQPAQDFTELNELIESQRDSIKTLKRKLVSTEGRFGELKRRWEEFRANFAKRTPQENEPAVDEITSSFAEVEKLQTGTQSETDRLTKNSDGIKKFTKDVTDGTLIRVFTGQNGSSATNLSQNANVTIPPESTTAGGDEQLKSENNVLRVQLQNAKALIDKNNEKISQLKSLTEDSDVYIETLEKETKKKDKILDEARTRIAELETANVQLSEGMHDGQRVTNRYKNELKDKMETLQYISSQKEKFESELNMFKSQFNDLNLENMSIKQKLNHLKVPEEYMALLNDKDQQLAKITKILDQKEHEMKQMRQDSNKLDTLAQENNSLKKRMAQKFEKLEVEHENMRQQSEAMMRKMAIATNLLQKERKAIMKLTVINEELRKDRMDYMNKTNAALKEHREMISKTNALSNHVQAETQKSQALSEQVELLKAKQKEAALKAGEYQKRVKELENENKVLKKSIGNTMGSGAASQVDAIKKKMEEVRIEQQNTTAKYAQAQHRIKELETQVASLEQSVKRKDILLQKEQEQKDLKQKKAA